MKKTTIKDIAEKAGVSPTAVSFTLNGRPGVGQETRERILTVAHEAGWTPSPRAQALSRARADAIGLVITRPDDSYASEGFYFHFLIGLQSELATANMDLVMRHASCLEEEMQLYREWSSSGRVDGVVLVEPVVGDPRFDLVKDLDLPAVVVGLDAPGLPSVITADDALIRSIVEHLVAQGARRIGYVSGDASFIHTVSRCAALHAYADEHPQVRVFVSEGTDFTETAGRSAASSLLEKDVDALIFDNEILTLGGLAATNGSAHADVLLFSCQDSPLCRATTPAISAVATSASRLSADAGRLVLARLRGQNPASIVEPVPTLVLRDSTLHGLPRRLRADT
ncbi:LacI family DNA-binding transcriptional regulator [Schaalia sp. 19OD2882]|uniref:LacI family DNA-binding transcriptional regulator n=1 Tax=Schaalia sp. 19OD2882 TaxID=2794089 RepID=UPI001C1E90FF|nr:LacI family DNA-binding transcriptional regulator [Schaalia sp. 19OD2882]QWW19990.1 LacI family DNA-binding transcriptional regulator [Schaalia sp. 19OD2882]